MESTVWKEAQLVQGVNGNHVGGRVQHESVHLSENLIICYIDGAWKEKDVFTGQSWMAQQRL